MRNVLLLSSVAVIFLLTCPGTSLVDASTIETVDARQTSSNYDDITCEGDALWAEIKRRLFFLLRSITESSRLDMSRGVNLLSRGVLKEDLHRCPVGAIAVQLFMQLALAAADLKGSWAALHAEPWPHVQDTPWESLSVTSWGLLVTSRWPIFEILSMMKGTFQGHGVQLQNDGGCADLWMSLSAEQRAHLDAGSDAGRIMGISLMLPTSACAAARVTVTVALLSSLAQCEHRAQKLLLEHAQSEATHRWPVELLASPWPGLLLLADFEKRSMPEDFKEKMKEALSAAIAYVNFQPNSMPRLRDIETSISTLAQYWLNLVPDRWPVIVFVDEASSSLQAARLQQRFPNLDIRIAVMDPQDLAWPMSRDHPFCSQGYRRAARFTAGPLYMHEALDSVTHLLVVDTEFEFTHPIPWDPMRKMFEQRSQLAYWQTHYEQSWNRTVYLTEISQAFMSSRGLQPRIPELVQYWWDDLEVPGGSLPVNIYGCLFAGSMSFFRSELFQSYFEELDRWTGWDEQCWSPQNVLAIAAGFFLHDGDISELWLYGRHQKSSKTPDDGWNLSRKGVLPEKQRPANLTANLSVSAAAVS